MECDLPSLHFSVFLINFVAHQHDRDVVADTGQIFVPFGDILVGDPGGHIEHDDGGMGANIISFPETSELLLSGSIPDSQLDGSVVCIEGDGADFDTLCSNVFFLEFPCDVPLHKGGFSDTSVSDQNNLEFSNRFRSLSKCIFYVHCC